jgi:ABC-type molybdate transport system substrate-binding protein
MRQVVLELGPRFESVSGHRVVTTFESSGLIAKRLEGADGADIVLINEAGLAQLARAGRIEEGSATPIATSRVGVAVRSGAPRPDISSPDALKRTLLAARMVSYPDPAQTFTFSAAIVRGGSDVAVAKTFIAFLQTPAARSVILAKGMDVPGR